MKTCSTCKEEKSLSSFGIDSQQKSGLAPRCKECRSELRKEARIGRTEEEIIKEKEKEKEYRNRPERKAAQAIRTKAWALRNKDKVRDGVDRYRFSEKGLKKRKEYKKSDGHKESEKRYVERNRIKLRAQKRARRAVEKGLLTKTGCEVCGTDKVHGHHPDYKEPLVVMWLCQAHHCEWHRLNGPGLNGD